MATLLVSCPDAVTRTQKRSPHLAQHGTASRGAERSPSVTGCCEDVSVTLIHTFICPQQPMPLGTLVAVHEAPHSCLPYIISMMP